MPRHQDQRQPQARAVRWLLGGRARLDARQPTAEVDEVGGEPTGPVRGPLVSLFEPDQPGPASATVSPASAGGPEPVTAPPTPWRMGPAWLLLVLTLSMAVGLAVGFVLGSARAGGPLPSAQAPRPSATQPTAIPQTSIVVRPAATPACLEAARRGDQVIELLIRNERGRAARLLVAYHVASRQCARDAAP
jgi:hypothetical protein